MEVLVDVNDFVHGSVQVGVEVTRRSDEEIVFTPGRLPPVV